MTKTKIIASKISDEEKENEEKRLAKESWEKINDVMRERGMWFPWMSSKTS